jgi:predicted DNA binding CopG/RHH family protein
MSKRKKAKKEIPSFKSEAEEREFWADHDSADYLDWSEASPVVLANLRPSTSTISLRLPDFMLEELKLLAHQRDVPYQSLLKVFLAERLQAERHRRDPVAG